MKKQKLSSLLPIAVFLIFYLGLGIWSEYIMKIPMGFYNIPIVVAFMLAILTACFQNRSLCGSLLCLYLHGNLRRNHHPDRSDCHCRI